MPSQDNRAGSQSGPVPIPGLNQQEPFSGPLEGEDGLTRPLAVTSAKKSKTPTTDHLPTAGQFGPQTSQFTHANLARVLTTTLPSVSASSTSQRIPVVIKGSMKKAAPAPLPPASHKKRRLLVTLVGLLMLVLVTSLALYSVTPLGHDMGLNWNPLAQQPGNSVIAGQGPGLKLVAQATATAVFHQQNDGYGGGAAQLMGNGAGSLNWPIGQCTFWANARYHALTGHWVPWIGNADQWVIGARSAGWNVSSQPHVPSIIVLMPYEQGAYGVGHVAVVENIVAGVSPVTVRTSNMNFYANGGSWDVESFFNFHADPGNVYFVWHS